MYRILAAISSAFLLFVLISCNENGAETEDKKSVALREIEKAEADFARMAADKGVAEAFWFFADSNAVIKRENDTLIKGREGIRAYYSTPNYANASVSWAPDYTDVSNDGNMGYTYGSYTWQSKDSAGRQIQFSGVFHTVWKRQSDGGWKYVWD